jgi:hypothetical protein
VCLIADVSKHAHVCMLMEHSWCEPLPDSACVAPPHVEFAGELETSELDGTHIGHESHVQL